MAQSEEGQHVNPELFENEEQYRKAFLDMKMMVEELYKDRQKKKERKDKK